MFKKNRNECCNVLKKDVAYELTNSEFGCSCNRDKKCKYENTCKQLMLEDEIYRLKRQLLIEKDLHSNYKIYYAHHLWKYNTEIEKYEIELIKNMFPVSTIINPNGSIEQNREESIIMKDCLLNVEDCDIIVFSSINGVVGKGVVDEVNKAKETGKRIYFIHSNHLSEAKYCKFKVIESSDSNRIYAIVSNVSWD